MTHNESLPFFVFFRGHLHQSKPAPSSISITNNAFSNVTGNNEGEKRILFKSKKPINDKPRVLILTAILLHNVNSWACFINVPVDKLFPWIFHPRSCGVTVSTLDFKSSVTGSNLGGTYQIFFGTKSSLFEIIFLGKHSLLYSIGWSLF